VFPSCRYTVAVADSAPQKQLPHIQSRLRVELGDELGLRGVAAGRLDVNKPPPMTAAARKKVGRPFCVTLTCVYSLSLVVSRHHLPFLQRY